MFWLRNKIIKFRYALLTKVLIYSEIYHNCSDVLLNRECYVSVHVLLNLINEMGNRVKMRGLSSI